MVWCLDGPGLGGAEIAFGRIFNATSSADAVIVHGDRISRELDDFFSQYPAPKRRIGAGNSWRVAPKRLREAFRLIREFPDAAFVVWAHHSDSNRWLQFALALSGRRFILAERLIPGSRTDFSRSLLSVPVKRFVARKAYAVVINRRDTGSYRNVFGIRTPISCIPNSRDVEGIHARASALASRRNEIRAELRLPQEAPIVLCLGRLAAQKGQHDLISAIADARISAAVLLLVGDGPDRDALRVRADAEAPGRVIFAGAQTDPLPWIAASDFFALPSREEGLSGALLEAMAAEIPCIATNIPGNAELIRNEETGLSVAVGDSHGLASAIHALMTNPDLGARLARAGYEHVQLNYDQSAEIAAWKQLLAAMAA